MSADPIAAAGLRPSRPVTPVGIIAEQLATVIDLLDGGATADHRLDARLRQVYALAAGLEPYVEQNATAPSPALAALAEATAAHDWDHHDGGPGRPAVEQEMLSGAVEGQLLRMLVRISGARRVLDIGMFTGYSALAVAEALPAGGRVVACEIDPFVAEFAQRCFTASPAADRIEVRVGPAAETLTVLAAAGESFDLVFLDADKVGYLGYLRALLDTDLLAPAGLVAVDNTLLQGQPWTDGDRTGNGAAIAAFNRAVAADPRIEHVLVPVRDGLTLIRRQ